MACTDRPPSEIKTFKQASKTANYDIMKLTLQLYHCETGQIVHLIHDELLMRRDNINCSQMQLCVDIWQYEYQVVSVQEES